MEELLRRPVWRVALVLLLALALLAGADSTPLFDQDEAAYAGFARGMRQSGDWVIHGYTWSEMHRKPPLALWLITLSTSLFGDGWWAVRLPGALCVAATCGLLATWGGALLGQGRATIAAAVLATSLLPVFGKIALVDPVLLLAETTSMLGLIAVLSGQARRGSLAALAGLAVGLLAKGPAVVLFLGASGTTLLLLHPQRRRLASPWLWLGLPLALVPLLAWGALAWRADGGVTVRWMLDWYLFARAGGQVLGQTGPPGTYLLTFLVFLLPWVAFLPAGLGELIGGLRRREPLAGALCAWLVGGWLIWELLPSKLPAYALGAYPALALLVAGPLARLVPGQRPVGLARAGLGGGLVLVLALAVGLGWTAVTLSPAQPHLGLLAAAAWLLVAGGGALLLLACGHLVRGLASALLVAPILVALLWLLALPELRPRLHPTWAVAQAVEDLAPAGAPVTLADAWRLPSLPLYLEEQGRTVTVVPTQQAVERSLRPGVLILPEVPESLPAGAAQVVVDAWIPDKGSPTRFVILSLPE